MARFLEPLRRGKKSGLQKFAVFDIETTGGLTGPFEMLGFYDGQNKEIFSSVKEFLDSVLVKSYRGYRFYAHNATRFDFQFIIDELLKMEIGEKMIEAVNGKVLRIDFLQAGDRIREIVIKDGSKHVFRMIDSFWLLPTSLKKAAESFAVEHQKTAIDYNKISIWDKASKEYCLNDCVSLYEVLKAYFDQDAFKGLKPKGTVAANAMQIFRTKMTASMEQTAPKVEDFIRRGYYGGRVEIFKLYGRGLNYYDFNSLYPYIMDSEAFPVGSPVWVDSFERGVPGFYHAEIDMPTSVNIPPLPVLKDSKLIFPVGKFTGYFVSCELEKAVELGARVKIKRGVIFGRSERIFRKYVKYFYDMKRGAQPGSALYLISKLYMNGLYGKFGQRREQSSIVRCGIEQATEEGMTPYLPDLGLYTKGQRSRGTYIMPHIASWVTAKARLKLYSVLKPDTHYCDTDSVFTPSTLPSDQSELGALKFEKHISEAIFLLPKFYALKTPDGLEVKAKGFGREFLTTVDFNDFKKGLAGNYAGFKVETRKLLGIKEGLRRFGRCPVVATARKSIKNAYTKRLVMPDLTTRPHELNGYEVYL